MAAGPETYKLLGVIDVRLLGEVGVYQSVDVD
jgi:hypothetical protein